VNSDQEVRGCPFPVGSMVTWVDDAPVTWRYIWTPGPMKVISARWDDGEPTEYAIKYYFPIPRVPGWQICVEYDADSTSYYDPPLSLLIGPRIRKEVHEMWLRLV
jgi:hypothetical protein